MASNAVKAVEDGPVRSGTVPSWFQLKFPVIFVTAQLYVPAITPLVVLKPAEAKLVFGMLHPSREFSQELIYVWAFDTTAPDNSAKAVHAMSLLFIGL